MKRLPYRTLLIVAALGLQGLLVASYAGAPDAVTPDGGRFYGTLEDGVFSGEGELRYDDGRRYRGRFADGRFHGPGRLEDAEGDVYEGEFEDGELVRGSYTRKDGARYEGGFRNWRFHGEGRYSDGHGTTYQGDFVDGSLEGRGKVSGHGRTYEGELKQWQFQGEGVLRHANGDVYEGSFEHGLYNGKGTLTYGGPRRDGRIAESGTWRYGRRFDPEGERKSLAAFESALYEQRRLLDRSLAALDAGERGSIDMYLLTVAGDGSQEVFRREVSFVQKTFAERFGTAGRSVALINSRSTLASAPMATVTSLRAALEAIAARMNPDEDILFLFLTSHGSAEHELVLNQEGMRLRGLPAATLAKLLKESAIRWKVVVVSACYSGGFIDPLKDERTLVITASRHDRRSFGCADGNDFTDFGRAFFKEALPGAGSFQDAFAKASVLVTEWEKNDVAKTAQAAAGANASAVSHSLPQIYSPKPIAAHLARWWAQSAAQQR